MHIVTEWKKDPKVTITKESDYHGIVPEHGLLKEDSFFKYSADNQINLLLQNIHKEMQNFSNLLKYSASFSTPNLEDKPSADLFLTASPSLIPQSQLSNPPLPPPAKKSLGTAIWEYVHS